MKVAKFPVGTKVKVVGGRKHPEELGCYSVIGNIIASHLHLVDNTWLYTHDIKLIGFGNICPTPVLSNVDEDLIREFAQD